MARIDPSTDPSKEAYNHGMALDPENKRVQCCYCGKVVPGFSRLQQHLGAIQGNVTECVDVPPEVKTFFGECLLSAKVGRLVKEVGDLWHFDPPLKRTCTSNAKVNGMTPERVARNQNGQFRDQKPGLGESMNSGSSGSKKLTCNSKVSTASQSAHSENCIFNVEANGVGPKNVMSSQNGQCKGHKTSLGNSTARSSLKRSVCNSNGILASQGACSGKEGQDPSSIMAKRCIGRFFFENGIDLSAVTSHSFQSMMEISLKIGEDKYSIPSIAELKGWILDDELNEIQNYVNEIRLSWSRTGCSILLDGWTDDLARNLINVIVDCPEGPIYLRSEDVSPATKGPDALQQLLEAVLEEVGIHNVVQIVAHTSSDSLEALSEQLIKKYRSLFWTVSPGHCMSLILDQIAAVNPIKLTLDKAKTITKFIYGHDAVLNLLRRHISSHDLVKASKIKAAAPFLTLENFVLERSNLELMFISSEWLNSFCASSVEGKIVANLVRDSSFWDGVTVAVKASIPLIKAISLINGDGEPNMGFIYETMDQVKETISTEFRGKKSHYTPYWKRIDDIWNTILHSPLHAAGYFLNPRLHYAEDFYSDTEVAGGLLITIVRMAEDQRVQDLISQQLNVYGGCKGDFKVGTANNSHHSLSPAAWWSRFGGHCPELQRMAFKILSQTCKGAESYGLRRDVAEKLLSRRRNFKEQRRLRDLTYIHYNLHLRQFKMGAKFDIISHDGDLMDDWIMDEHGSEAAKSETSGPSKSAIQGERSCGAQQKTEPKGET